LRATFEEGTWAAWLYDLPKPHVTGVVVCNPRKAALLKDGSKNDRIDAHKLAELLYMKRVKSVYHGEHSLRTMKELARSYLTITKDVTRVMNRIKALRELTSQREEAHDGTPNLGEGNCGDHVDRLEEGGTQETHDSSWPK
jgi:transposase